MKETRTKQIMETQEESVPEDFTEKQALDAYVIHLHVRN